ncbi:MAG TPA: hypothetical protein VE338_20755 [Ktedonobacterales bacterium]|jgi:hypothetical protein|nr:hypothetical protein [Ktedonobacterales bacterium]
MESRASTERLIERLEAIGASLAQSGHALALIGLGSVGEERDRLDVYSDLDFFAVVEPGCKDAFIDDLSWLERVHPIAFAVQNTRDGDKVLFADGIYAEFAVFVPDELSRIPMHRGRVVWQADGFTVDLATMRYQPPAPPEPHTVEWLAGEILTNLYVGLTRFHRGERLSAMRLIQVHAVDRLVELSPRLQLTSPHASADPFSPERRYEARYPDLAAVLPRCAQGYDRSVESALAMLAFLETRLPVNAALKRRILDLCTPASPDSAL